MSIRESLTALCIALLVSGCNNESIDAGASPNDAPKRLYASFELPDTRTYIDTELKIHWHEADEISLFAGSDTNARYIFEGATGDRSGYFTRVDASVGEDRTLWSNYAIYPYNATTSISDDGSISYTLPHSQSYAEDSFARGSNVMLSTSEPTDNDLYFRNCCGYLRLQLYAAEATIRSITLRGNNDEPLAGSASIATSDTGEPIVVMSDNATHSALTIDCGDGLTLSKIATAPTNIWLALPPTLFAAGFTVTIVDNAGCEMQVSTSKPIAIQRNIVQPMAAVEVLFDNEAEAVTFERMSGTWQLDKWRGATANFEVYMQINEDGTVTLWQRIASREWSRYESVAALNGDIISGTYSDGVAWSTGYGVTFDSGAMTWQSTTDATDISLYTRATLPEGLSTTRTNYYQNEHRHL